jgi:hypothetical protein
MSQHSTETTAVHLTARELAILEGGLFELAENIVPVDTVLHNKLKAALAALPQKHCLKWCCLTSDNPKPHED